MKTKSPKNEYRGNSPSVTTTKKKTVSSKAKTNWEADVEQALENAEQVKSWNKYGECKCYDYFVWGLLVACVTIVTVSAMWSASTLQIN